MKFFFDLQRFAEVTLLADETYALDGVTYTAITDAVLNLDDNKVSGIASGKVSAVATGKTDPIITIDASQTEISIAITNEDDSLAIKLNGLTSNLGISSGSLTISPTDRNDIQKISVTAGTTFSIARDENSTVKIVAKEDTIIDTERSPENIRYFRTDNESYDFNVSLVRDNTTVIGGTLTVGGMFSYSPELGTFALVNPNIDPENSKESFAALKLGDYTLKASTAGSTVIAGINILENGKLEINYPREDYNTTDLTISRGDTQIFGGKISVNGSMLLDRQTNSITLKDGSEISVEFGDYEVTATADGDATISFALTESGLAITPVQGDGTLNLQFSSENGSMSANLEVLSGSFILGENGAVTIAKDTELKLDFGGGYIVNFKTTDDAGGSISLGNDGITFTPNDGDGHLELSVTRDGETRTASLDMTGSLTYKLDGSISLAKDTVVTNEFDSGRSLTITANTNASGSIVFIPQNGLTITPSTADALTVEITRENAPSFKLNEIVGTIHYSGGVITLADGTELNGELSDNFPEGNPPEDNPPEGSPPEGAPSEAPPAPMPGDEKISVKTEGGTSTIDFTNARTIAYVPGNDATLTLDIGPGLMPIVLTSGSLFDGNGSDSMPETGLSAGTNLIGIFKKQITLFDAGNYMLNGMKVTTTADGAKVQLVENNSVTIDGITYTALDDNVTITIGENGATVAGGKVSVLVAGTEIPLEVDVTDSSLSFDSATKKFTFAEGTILSMQAGTSALQFVAKEDFSIGVNTGEEISFKLDGAANLEIVNGDRKATLDFTGGLAYESGGSLSLDDGTEINLAWEDGTELKITSSGSTGSIAFDADKGLKITSDDENLDMTLTTPYMSTNLSGLKGTIYYKAGTVSFDANSTITATTTLGGQPILMTLETVDGTGHISFGSDINGIIYSADTGAMKITWSRNDLESTFTVNSGSVQIGHGLFKIAKGTNLATDLKNFVPALYFTTSEAGTYTINGQTITTSAEGLALTATDDQMVFKTSSDVVEYDGMTFAGNGNVSLKPDSVVLGAGVEATGFGEGKSFVLAEAGNVTADAKVFELTPLDLVRGGESVPIPMIITVTGAQDGFIFSRTLTDESEEYLGYVDSPYVGQVFVEKFISAGDSSYRTRTDPIGLEEVIGISDGATITGGASLADEPTLSYYNLVTDTEGKFTIGEKTYAVSGDSSIALRARFEENTAPYASMVDSLNGTINGDFSGGEFKVNGSSAMKIIGDTDVSIVADDSGFEILGLDAGSSLQVSTAGNYSVNGTAIAAGASAVIVGTKDGKARLYNLPAILADFMLHKTALGYPQMATLAFHPDEDNPDTPENYHSAEKWTTTSTDNLKLSAMHYSPENPTGKWVILVHGYGKTGAAMNAIAEPYLAQGIDVLIIDQRAAGDSEGEWLTMGVAEANDLAIWTQEIAKTNANAQITLHGVSMGAATVMLCAALPETTNVSAIIEDCGYGNIADVFASLLYYYGSSLGVSGIDFYELFDDVNEVAKMLNGGYDIADAAPIDSIAAVTVPSLFIHGANDEAIPLNVVSELYNASGATNKTKLIVEGAAHARSVEIDSDAYFTAVNRLIDSSTTEIGALIDSDIDNKLLRGTIYNDTIENSGTKVTIEALGGDDYIINNVDSTVTAAEFGNLIEAGDGNDTVYNHHTYNPTIYGGAGDDSIVISRGHKTFIDSGEGNDSIIGRFANNPASDWAIGGHATVLGGDGNDYISTGYTNDSSIDGGNSNDTIITCGLNNTINGGDGNNLISLDVIDREDLSQGSFIVLNGNTTVEGFNTGFGEGTDTIYIDGDPAAVDFKEGVLAFYNGTDSLTLSDVTTTAKVNIYHKRREVLNKGVFIADNDWYNVSSSDLSVSSGEEVYFVGPSATPNHGVDFSGITQNLNVTMDTAYVDSEDYVPGTSMWINGVYSLKGGAGLTTITGSDKSDTIVAGTGSTTINAAGGDDIINLGSASALVKYNSGDGDDLIRGFNENSTLNISGAFYSSKKRGNNLVLTVGEDEITLVGAANLSTVNIDGTSKTQAIIESISAKNYTVVDAAETGTKNISLSGAEVVVVEDTRAKVSIMASDGEDSIFSDGQNVTVNLDNGGNSWLFVTGGKMTLEGYDNTTGAGFNEPYDDIVSEIADKILSEEITFDDGKLSMGAAVVSFGKVTSEIVNFYNALVLDELQQVGFASKGKSIDTSGDNSDLILVGNTDSTLTSGAGNDTIFADDGGFVDAGAGNNLVDLSKGDKYGTTVAFTSKGSTTVDGFNAGFDKSSDILFFDANDSISIEFDGNDITLNSDNGATGLISDVADDAPFVEIFVANEVDTTKMIIAKKDATITPDDLTARVYIGENSAVDFSNATKNLSIDLSGIVDTNSDNPLMFSGITQITTGNGQNTIIGSDADETLIAGSSENSIYGAGGHNLLQGYSGDDKDGSTKFFVLGANDGAANTISNFAFVNAENRATSADVIEIDAGANFIKPESIAVRGDDVAFTVENSRTGAKESVLIENAASTSDNVKDMYITDDVIAQISANDLCFDEFANFYVATGNNATVNVSSAVDGEVDIWLDDDAAAENDVEVSAIFAGDIKVIDATKSDATAQLAGNELDNEIYAGNGDASLWGGNGGDDLLVGGTAQNIFFYTLGNGNDTVTGVNDGDSVILSGVKLEDIIDADFTNNSLSLYFSDGGKLTVNENGKNVNFVVGDQTFRVNNERNDFTAR